LKEQGQADGVPHWALRTSSPAPPEPTRANLDQIAFAISPSRRRRHDRVDAAAADDIQAASREQASPDRAVAAADIETATGSRRAPIRQGCHCSRMERGAAEKHLRPAHQGVAGRCRRGGSPGRRCSYAGAATGPRQPWVWRFSCRVGLVDGGWDPSLCPDWALQRRDWPVAAEQKPLSWGGSMLQIPSFLVTRPRSTLAMRDIPSP
jgi:hypothetical protein